MESDSKGRDQSNSSSGSISINNGNKVWKFPYGADGYHPPNDASLFSSSLPVLPHEKLESEYFHHSGRAVDDTSFYKLDAGTKEKDPLDDLDLNALPGDEDELLAGVMEALGLNFSSNQTDDLEEYDLFGSGGGLELESDSREYTPIGMRKMNIADVVLGNGFGHQQFANGVAKTSGEHPYGEHPSRTLFVRNINSNVEDSELTSLFQRFGDIRTLYTACKHRGFVMISYYDIRAARTAMRILQGKPLRRRNLDIHFSIPKDNPSEKDMNQGTLVIFNLDSSVSNDDLLKIFGVYGEVKEIRETPNKRHHKFIEYYDVRAAEAALKALNRIDIAGKRIKLEPSRPGGARRGLMLQQLTQELERDEAQVFQGGSPVANSPPGNWSLYGSPAEHTPLHVFSSSPGQGSLSPVNTSRSPGLASLLPHHMSNSPKLAPIGKDQFRTSSTNAIYVNSGSGHNSSPHSSGNRTLSGPEFLWGSPKSPSQFPDYASTSLSTSPSAHQHHPFSYTSRRSSLLGTHQNHIGSAPSGGYLDQHLGCFSNSPDKSCMGSAGYGIMGLNRNNGSFSSHIGPLGTINTGFGLPGNMENSSPSFHTMSVPRPFFPGNGSYTGFSEGFIDRNRGQVFEYTANQIDSKKQFHIDLDKIISGEDTRTTLMIKNIPNKYTSKMLLAAIDENHGGTYNFLYLPIDFKNKCNVGYAFINMVSPSDVISFYQTFNGKKWEKFNSEKVATLAYARIQGKTALVAHFQNSSLMNEDKRCRPIIFLFEGQQIGAQEHLLSSNLNICIRQPDGSYSVDALESSTYNPDENPDKFQL